MIVKLTKLQLRRGFDERYEPNAIGMAMEDLIDKLFQR